MAMGFFEGPTEIEIKESYVAGEIEADVSTLALRSFHTWSGMSHVVWTKFTTS